jgi:hypothetical protein
MALGMLASVAVFWLGAANEPPAADKAKAPDVVRFGSFSDGALYTTDVHLEGKHSQWITLWQTPFPPPCGAMPEPKKFDFSGVAGDDPYCWRVRGGLFWGVFDLPFPAGAPHIVRLPVEDLAVACSVDEKDFADYRKRHPQDPDWSASPVTDKVQETNLRRTGKTGKPLGMGTPEPLRDLYYDVLPTTKTEALLFILVEKRLWVWRGVATKQPAESLNEWNVVWQRKAPEVEVDINEPFTAVSQGDAVYFVTRSGKLYSVKQVEKDKWKVQAAWSEAASPIRSVVRDEDAGRAFAFTEPAPDAKDGRMVYFELSDKPDPAAYEPKPLKDAKFDEPLATVMGLARFLHDQKKLK